MNEIQKLREFIRKTLKRYDEVKEINEDFIVERIVSEIALNWKPCEHKFKEKRLDDKMKVGKWTKEEIDMERQQNPRYDELYDDYIVNTVHLHAVNTQAIKDEFHECTGSPWQYDVGGYCDGLAQPEYTEWLESELARLKAEKEDAELDAYYNGMRDCELRLGVGYSENVIMQTSERK